MSQGTRHTSHMVAEIFADVGAAFTKLGELEMSLNPEAEHSPYRHLSTDKETQLLRAAVKKFGDDIDKICQRIKDRTLLQIRNSMKRHAYEDAGLPLRKQQMVATSKPAMSQQKARNTSTILSQSSAKSADITLNMLNATEQEVDVEGLASGENLEYDSPDAS